MPEYQNPTEVINKAMTRNIEVSEQTSKRLQELKNEMFTPDTSDEAAIYLIADELLEDEEIY